MKRTGSLIAFSVVAVLAGTLALAQRHPEAQTHPKASHRVAAPPAAAHTLSSRAVPAARGVATVRGVAAAPTSRGAPGVPAPSLSAPHPGVHVTPIPLHTPAVAKVAQRNALGIVSPSASSAARHRGAPLNALLGGPATFDARRLVRR
jgi:hypothetical protein